MMNVRTSELMESLSSDSLFVFFNFFDSRRQEKLLELQWNDPSYFVIPEGITPKGRTLWPLLIKHGVFYSCQHFLAFLLLSRHPVGHAIV
jgi:hypothetical protein